MTRRVTIDAGTDADRMAGVFVLCPAGKRVVGGGGYSWHPGVVLQSSYPTYGFGSDGSLEGWYVITRRVIDEPVQYYIETHAICATAG